MNNEQVARALLSVRKTAEPFAVVMSGKKSGKVNGLYKPESREIIIHNKNFALDDELLYTAIHEYAHHISEKSDGDKSHVAHIERIWGNVFAAIEKKE